MGILACAFWRSYTVLLNVRSRRLAVVFLCSGVLGCSFCLPMAWVSMAINRQLHLLFALLTFTCWLIAFSVRAASGVQPCAACSRICVATAILSLTVWITGICVGKSLSLAEWIAAICLISTSLTLPVAVPP